MFGRTFSLAACGVLLLINTASATEPVDIRTLDGILKRSLDAWEVPGAAVAVVRDDKIIYLQGVGVRELGGTEKVTPDTLFAIGSCTKAFTTTLMAMLVDEGKMSWDDPVRKHLDYFHLRDPLADRAVTLRDLVTHRAGVGSNDLLWYRSPLSQEQLIRRLALLEPAYPFRSGFRYQTTMFTAAGHAVSAASGETWSDLVRKRIFEPLGMKSAVVTAAEALKSDDHAMPHRRDAKGSIAVVDWYNTKVPEPAGSIAASASDMAQWLRFHLRGGLVGDKRLVSPKNLEETHSPQNVIRMEGIATRIHPETKLMSYGMGWVIQDYQGEKLVSHAGLIDGFRIQVTLVPERGLGIVVLTNLHDARMTTSVCYSFLDELLGLKHRNWDDYLIRLGRQEARAMEKARQEREEKREPDSKATLPLGAYAGTYKDDAYGTMTISLKGDLLHWRWNAFESPLRHYQQDTFTAEPVPIGELELRFSVVNGKITGLKIPLPIDREFRKSK